MTVDRRGVLYPGRLPEFHRLPPPPELDRAVRWFWIPEWRLEPGVESRQQILPFPACNLVVEPHGVTVVGPPTRRSERVLSGSGWAVGALLKPAAAPALIPGFHELRDASATVDEPRLHDEVSRIMGDRRLGDEQRRSSAIEALSRWILARLPAPSAEGELANRLADELADPAVVRVQQLAPRLHTSTRTLQRIAAHYFGLPLGSMIRRRRLQEAAQRLRDDPSVSISEIASELGYSGHAHFTTDFKAVVGVTPSDYRAEASEPSSRVPPIAPETPGV